MKPRRAWGSDDTLPRGQAGPVALALALGVLLGGGLSLYTQWGAPALVPAASCAACPAISAAAALPAASGLPADPRGPTGGVWHPAGREALGSADLLAVLRRVAVNDEVLVAVSNSALVTPDGKYGMLATWVECVKRVGVTNYLVIAMDDATAAAMDAVGVATWRATAKSLADNNLDNHGAGLRYRQLPPPPKKKTFWGGGGGECLRRLSTRAAGISSQKFHLLREFLLLGYRVLLSDVDVVALQNPFSFLARDSDVEALSDGFDERTAYGYVDGVDDPGMVRGGRGPGRGQARGGSRSYCGARAGPATRRLSASLCSTPAYSTSSPANARRDAGGAAARNQQGLRRRRQTNKQISLMDRITAFLAVQKAWDQTVFNEMIWYPSHRDKRNSQVSARRAGSGRWSLRREAPAHAPSPARRVRCE